MLRTLASRGRGCYGAAAMTDAPRILDETALRNWALWLQQARRFAEAEQHLDAVRRAARARRALEGALETLAADHPLREEVQMLLANARRTERELSKRYEAWSERLHTLHERRLDPEYQAEVVSRPLPEGLPG